MARKPTGRPPGRPPKTPRPTPIPAPALPAPRPPDAPGLVCPACHCRHFETVKTTHRARYVYRRRECRHCGRRVTTTEKIL